MTPLEGKEYEGILFEKYGLKSNYSLMLGITESLSCLICKSIPGIWNILDNIECQNMK